MTPERFVELAQIIGGRFWKSRLPQRIGKARSIVWQYANGKLSVDDTVAILMEELANNVRQ